MLTALLTDCSAPHALDATRTRTAT